MSYEKDKPYNDLPLLPPRAPLETLRTLKKAIGAHKALAGLKGAGNLIPNQTILLRSIVLQEARLSSEIENIVTTNDKLYKAFSDDDGGYDLHTKEVLRYQDALWHGYTQLESGRPLSTSLFVEIVNSIRQNEAGIRTQAGTCIVNLSGDKIYTPPDGAERLRGLLENLSQFIYANDDLDPLIKMAMLHYQFEAIHPFSDGNGRTGRIINILYLVSQELIDVPVLYLSRYIIDHKAAYYRGLKRVTEDQAWEEWVLYLLDAVEQTAIETRDKILTIRRVLDEALVFARESVPKVYSKELIELIFQQPYCKIQSVEQAGIAKRQTASFYLQELERIGLLRGVKIGRERLYVNDALYGVLTA